MSAQEATPAGDSIVAETKHCKIGVPQRPHVSREEGGHIVIFPKRAVAERQDLTYDEAVDVMMTSIQLGQAMTEVLTAAGIPIRTINYQDNGNWCFLRGEPHASFHVHLYGRAENTEYQTFGESLCFPDPNERPGFYDRNKPLTSEDIEKILARFKELAEPGSNCPVGF